VGADAGDSSLVLIDVATGTTTAIDTGFSSAPVYFVSSDGHRIVIFSIESDIPRVDGGVAGASVQLAVADLDLHSMNASVLIDRPAPALGTFVDRRGHDELWFLHPDDGQLDRLDLVSGAYEVVPVSFRARGIGYLPVHDLIVFGEDSPPAVRFWDPSTRATVRDVPF
jgi:hypothetical protein